MKRINIIYANNSLKDQRFISNSGDQTLEQFVSNIIQISPNEFYFEDISTTPLYLKSISDLSTIKVKFHHPSDNLIFLFPDNAKITIEHATKMNYNSIVKYLENYGFYFSVECIEKSLRFSIFGLNFDKHESRSFLEGIPINVPVYIRLLQPTVIIESNEMKFYFCENEKLSSVIKFLKSTFLATIDFKIRLNFSNICTYGDLQLKLEDKYEILGNFMWQFNGPKGLKVDLKFNCQSTFNDAKNQLNYSPDYDVRLFVGNKEIKNLNMSILPNLKKGNFYFEVIKKQNPSYSKESYPPYLPQLQSQPAKAPAQPPFTPPAAPAQPPPPVKPAAPAQPPPPVKPTPPSASTTPAPSDLTKSQPKKPVKVKISEIEEEIEILFQFEKSIGKEIKPIKKQFKSSTTINDIIEIFKDENDLDCEIEMSYKEDDDKVKIDPNQTIKSIQSNIIQPNKQNIIYVGSPQKKSTSKSKRKIPKVFKNYNIDNSENDVPSKKASSKRKSKEKAKKKSEQINKITYIYQVNGSDKDQIAELGPEATVEEFKYIIKDQYDVDDILNIKLIFAGKDLLNEIVLKNLNIGDTPLFVYIRSDEEIFLKTAKALQVIKIEEEEEIND